MTMVLVRKHNSLPFGPMRKFLVWIALLLTMSAAAGCDVSSSTPKTSADAPRVEKLKTNLTTEEARELAAPASSTPGLSVDTAGAQSAATEGFETEAKGLVRKRLFDTAAGNDDERFERLEAAVQALRDDFDTAAPAINRLMAIEQEIQGLVDQLQVLVEGDSAPADLSNIPPVSSTALSDAPVSDGGTATTLPPVATPPVPIAPSIASTPPAPNPVPVAPVPPLPAVTASPPAPAPAAPPASAPQAASPQISGATLVAARAADHNATTRVVFETTGNIPYTADVDPEQILIVSFASGSAGANLSGASMKSSLVKSMDVTPQNGGGMIVAMPLSKNTRIVGQGVLKPDGPNKNYRVYIDLAR